MLQQNKIFWSIFGDWLLKVPSQQTDHFNSNPSPTGPTFQHWLQKIKDDIPVTKLSIPGTHDSATYKTLKLSSTFYNSMVKSYFSRSYQCQAWTIETQLLNGIRFLDLRIRRIGDILYTAHGQAQLRQFREDAKMISHFLDKYKSQFIILAFSRQGGDVGDSSEAILQELNIFNIKYHNLNSNIPNVGELRGKVWIIRDNELSFRIQGQPSLPLMVSGVGDITSQTKKIDERHINKKVFLQNYWQVGRQASQGYISIKQKTEFARRTAFQINHQIIENKATKQVLKVNFLSGVGSGTKLWPYQLTQHQEGGNNAFNQRLKGSLPEFGMGVTVMDFPGQPLIQKIIESNKKHWND